MKNSGNNYFYWQNIFAGKNYFCQSGFYRGKYRFFPLTGKNLPTLVEMPMINVHSFWCVTVCVCVCVRVLQRTALVAGYEQGTSAWLVTWRGFPNVISSGNFGTSLVSTALCGITSLTVGFTIGSFCCISWIVIYHLCFMSIELIHYSKTVSVWWTA